MDAGTIEQVKAKHPGVELFLLSSGSAEVIAKVGKVEVDMFKDLVMAPATKSRAMERFVRACVIFPSPEEVLTILQRKPALVEKWGDKLLDEAGHAEEVELKKL